MNLVAWLAFGAFAGYTAFYLADVDRSIGPSGQVLIAIVGSMAGGLVAVLFGADPFALRIDLLGVSFALVGSIAAVVGREETRERHALATVAVRISRARRR